MRASPLIVPALVATLLTAVAAAPAAPRRSGMANGGAQLLVQPTTGFRTELDVSLELAPGAPPPGRIVLEVPRGFEIYPERPAGSAVGTALVVAANSSYGTPTFSTLAGDVVAQAPPVAAGGCTGAAADGLWLLELSLLGQPFEVPLLLAAASAADPAPAASSIVLCVPSLPASDPAEGRALPITSLQLSLSGLEAPSRHGSYLWRALVTPLAPDGRTLRPDETYEVRAVVPVPNRLTIAARYDASRRAALLRGRLTANGLPRAGVWIEIVRLLRGVTPGGSTIGDSVVGWAKTNGSGAYSFAARALKPSTFVGVVAPLTGRCRGAAVTPAGCVSSTLPGTESEPITVAVRPR